jgi:excisionase family DNA binding protein
MGKKGGFIMANNGNSLLTAKQVADHLGVSVQFVRIRTMEKTIPHIKFGRAVRFEPEQIEEYIRKHRRGKAQ